MAVHKSNAAEVRLAGRVLPHPPHVCAFFHSKDEEFRALGSFISDGLKRGEKAFHIVDKRTRSDHVSRLGQLGIDVPGSESSGQLEVCAWEDAYLRDGYFDQQRQLKLIEEVLEGGRTQGFPLTRLVANMEWALEDRAGVADIVEYESRLNYILPKYADPVICTYDLSRFGADVVMDIMRTHPIVIVGGVLQENPFYVPPDQFLSELAARKTQ